LPRRKILDGNGLVFGVVGILDDLNDKQMIETGAGAAGERYHADDLQPDWVDGEEGAARKPPGIGEQR
jgi:formyl-CoA transferase